MYNSAQYNITADNLDRLLRIFLLEANTEKEVRKVFEMQSRSIFSGNIKPECFLPGEKELIEKLANEKGYLSAKSNKKGLFAWIFSSIFIFVILFFAWKLFIITDNNVIALQVKRHSFAKQTFDYSPKKTKPTLSDKLLPVIINKQDSIKPTASNSIKTDENKSYFFNSNFPYKQPKIVYGKGGNIFLNLDFEVKAPGTNLPDVWYVGDGGKIGDKIYTVKIDSLVKYSGNNSIMLQRIEKVPNNIVFGCETNSLPFDYFRDKDSITISSYIKTDNVQGGYATLWCSEWDGNPLHNAIKYANSNLQGGAGTSDWKLYTIKLPIDTAAIWISFGGYLTNTGTAWFDNFEVLIDGEKIKDVFPVVKSPDANEIEWLNNNCIPIKTLNVGNDFNDLEKLNDIIGDAQIVALGGSSYGSSEEILMKQRVTEFLTSEKGFNIICIDAGMPESSMLNNYIQNGEGKPLIILDSLHSWRYNCKEMLKVTEWMRSFNQKSKTKLSLYGTGMQYDENAIKVVKDFATINDKKLLKKILKLEEKYSAIKEKTKSYTKENLYINVYQTKKLSKEIMPLMEKTYHDFENNKEEYLKNITTTQYEWCKQMLVIIKQNITQTIGSYNYYAKYYTDNVNWILKQNPEAKIIIWSLNSTIEKENTWTSAGKILFQEYGNKFVSIGFDTDSGTYTAYKDSVLSVNNIVPSIKGSFEDYFSQCKYPDFIVDLRKPYISEPSAKWLGSEMWFRLLWNTYNDKQFYRRNIAEKYDALVFLRNTNHSECFDIGKKLYGVK